MIWDSIDMIMPVWGFSLVLVLINGHFTKVDIHTADS